MTLAARFRVLLAAAAAMLPAAPVSAELSSAVARSGREVAGLAAPAEIIVDFWGIPHIYAASAEDAFFLQGYNAARDRLWQIDLWRKRGLGLLAKDFGSAFVAQDRASRLFLYRGDMNAEWAAYGPHAKGYAEAFVKGINAFVGEIRAGARPLPVEFKIAGNAPDLWSAEDVVRIRSHGLTRNASSEVRRAELVCLLGADAGLAADRLRVKLEPAWITRVPAGLDPCDVPRSVLADYDLATRGVTFTPEAMKRSAAPVHDPGTFLAGAGAALETVGSNNWVVAGARTATGRPILANDPHRAHGAPSLRYIVHLDAPGLAVVGAGEPSLPGISIGHNGTIAFGLTIFGIDQEDLYVYALDPANPGAYRYGNGWEAMRRVSETIEVKGEAARVVELRFTRHGPVLAQDPAAGRAFALRSVWFEPGTAAYFGSADYMTATDWQGFSNAMARFGTPSENQVYADTAGNVGWLAAGKTPRRDAWDGLMPVPGDGRYEWSGFFGAADLPRLFNPKEGWVATANQMNLPADYPIRERKIGFEWTNPSRYDRLVEVLAANGRFSLADAMALQNDEVSVIGRKLAALLAPLRASDPDVAAALALVRAWDGRVSEDSAAATLVEIWTDKYLGKAVVARLVPTSEPAARAAVGDGALAAMLDLLAAPDRSLDRALGRNPREARDSILLESFAAAVSEVRGLLGPDPAGWGWGRLHHAQFEHALSPLADPAARAQMSVGRLAMGGAGNTPRAASYRSSDWRVVSGASFRMVLDVGNWDDSVVINAPGQSGDPYSPHYRDLAPLWAAGKYVPLLYSRAAVERAAREVITLTPAR